MGELDEEMVYESRVGDIITLGTSTWQIQEITRDRVIVTPAPGRDGPSAVLAWGRQRQGLRVRYGRRRFHPAGLHGADGCRRSVPSTVRHRHGRPPAR